MVESDVSNEKKKQKEKKWSSEFVPVTGRAFQIKDNHDSLINLINDEYE